MFIPAPLKAALEDSISSGNFIDTKFWVFSRYNRETGRLEQPRAVFANSTVVRSIPYLSALLDRVPDGPLNADFPQAMEEPLPGEYEYQSDSDLCDGIAQSPPLTPSSTSEQDQIAEGCRLSLSRLGRTVIVRDAAFATFRAVLAYLYTREIKFGTWFSSSSGLPPTSAKSVYRLADKYGIPDLKELALLEIKSDVKTCNIVDESFEKFVSWYPEIQDLYMYRLAQAVRSSDSPGVAVAFDTKIQDYFAGKLPHARDLVLGLFDLLASNRMSPHPSPPGSSHSTITPYSDVNHGSWIQLRNAITRSLTTGVFLNSMFYVEDSMELRPLFFCSSTIPAAIKKISDIGKSVPVDALRGSPEWVAPGGVDAVAAQYATSENALVVTMGNWKTWKSILLYIYTAKISFAPFGASASPPVAGSSSNPGVSHEGVDLKLVYEIATKIGLGPLRDIAYQNIKSSMTSENIVEELLSTFSAEHEPIREMQYRLLQQEFWTADIQRRLRTNIEQSSGRNSHCGSAMVAVFHGLTGGNRTEGPAGVPRRSIFHTEPEPSNPNTTLFYGTITTAPAHRNTSQEELRLAHYQQNPRTTLNVRSSNSPSSNPLSQTGTRGGTFRLR